MSQFSARNRQNLAIVISVIVFPSVRQLVKQRRTWNSAAVIQAPTDIDCFSRRRVCSSVARVRCAARNREAMNIAGSKALDLDVAIAVMKVRNAADDLSSLLASAAREHVLAPRIWNRQEAGDGPRFIRQR